MLIVCPEPSEMRRLTFHPWLIENKENCMVDFLRVYMYNSGCRDGLQAGFPVYFPVNQPNGLCSKFHWVYGGYISGVLLFTSWFFSSPPHLPVPQGVYTLGHCLHALAVFLPANWTHVWVFQCGGVEKNQQ